MLRLAVFNTPDRPCEVIASDWLAYTGATKAPSATTHHGSLHNRLVQHKNLLFATQSIAVSAAVNCNLK